MRQYNEKGYGKVYKRRTKSKYIFRRLILFIIFVFTICFVHFNILSNSYINSNRSGFYNNYSNNNSYEVIKKDLNPNYIGIGQKKENGKDGYFTSFTTEDSYKKKYIEYKQNGNASWSNNSYWNSTMSESGCGIVSLSIVLSGYGFNYTPEDLRKIYYPKMNYENLSDELANTYNIKNSNFYFDNIRLSAYSIKKHLSSNRPIIVCVWDKSGSNRWTTASHYMVLLACDNNDMIYVSNPNGLENDCKSSGWYNSDEIVPYIAKALYIESYKK